MHMAAVVADCRKALIGSEWSITLVCTSGVENAPFINFLYGFPGLANEWVWLGLLKVPLGPIGSIFQC